jgi:hypothetical protein
LDLDALAEKPASLFFRVTVLPLLSP